MHAIDAFMFAPTVTDPLALMASVILDMPRSEILEQNTDYLHATFSSALFGFVDDVEIVRDGNFLQVRSVSRVGYGDMGVNRARIETLRQAWQQALP